MPADRTTRFAADLVESATMEGKRESRSAKEQLDHWARVGRSVCAHGTAARRRIEAAVAGELELRHLSEAERVVANAEINANIQARAQSLNFGRALRSEGVATVSLDEHGALVERRPDGSRRLLDPAATPRE